MINYITTPNFLSKQESQDLLQFSLTKELKPAMVGDSSKIPNLKYRKSNVFFYDYSLKFPNLNEKLIEIFKKEVNVKGYNIDFTNNMFQFTEYTKDGYYNWHEDSDSVMKERYCSMVIQLNDEYTGGELQIKDKDNNEITLEKGLGNLFIFYSHLTHRVKPITTGTRYSLVNWFRLTPIENFKKTLI
jgi:PKHD-type hydroxylase